MMGPQMASMIVVVLVVTMVCPVMTFQCSISMVNTVAMRCSISNSTFSATGTPNGSGRCDVGSSLSEGMYSFLYAYTWTGISSYVSFLFRADASGVVQEVVSTSYKLDVLEGRYGQLSDWSPLPSHVISRDATTFSCQ
eukprot:TRINITY_DN2899_c0_g1_i1.p1 TRINITY_DN2899_c0_g1~~TRINITY_DN2899_c0_g1_i1.p1  ORF type:complete len:138 (-),score=6.82 TRINITY_DN2899_c0_g1_i1:68-481(-)